MSPHRGKPFEPDPGRAGVGTGNASERGPFSALPHRIRVLIGARRSVMPDSAPLAPPKAMRPVEELRVTTGPFPASRKIYAPGRLHPELAVAMREIDLEPSAGEPPVRVYDTSGPYSDPAAAIDIMQGLPELRRPWILARGDVEEYRGRDVKPEDNGLRRGE